MSDQLHPMAPHHLPAFITAPGETDIWMVVMGIFLVLTVLAVGTSFAAAYVARTDGAQVAEIAVRDRRGAGAAGAVHPHPSVLGRGLMLALIDLPDLGTPLRRIAGSVEKMAGNRRRARAKGEAGRRGAEKPRPRSSRRWCTAMLELLLCSIVTILPDYLYRRYVQGKRFGKEITFYSVWFELRWGITACLMLTIGLITVVFYFHPSTSNVTLFFRTVPIVPETNGRVAEIYVGLRDKVAERTQPIFRLDSSKQEATVEPARRKIVEVEASMVMAQADILAAEGQIQQAKGSYQQALDELNTKKELFQRNPNTVAKRDLERLEVLVQGRQGAVDAATATKQAAETRLSTLLPAEKASAQAELAQAQVDLDKTVVRAGVSGQLEQFCIAGRRHRQSVVAPGGNSHSRGRRSARSAGRFRTDRGADHEARDDC